MELLIDNADLSKIERLYDIYPIDGVTTNPSILAESGRRPYEVLRDIRSIIGEEAQLHVQVISVDASSIVDEAHRILDKLPGNTLIKIPAIPEGIKAIRILSHASVPVTATVIYSPMQALLAAKAGASYAAPYVNRIENLGLDAIECVRTMQKMIISDGLKTKILGASFKNSFQVISLMQIGAEAITLSPSVLSQLLENKYVDMAVDNFISDFEALCGKGSSMLTESFDSGRS